MIGVHVLQLEFEPSTSFAVTRRCYLGIIELNDNNTVSHTLYIFDGFEFVTAITLNPDLQMATRFLILLWQGQVMLARLSS